MKIISLVFLFICFTTTSCVQSEKSESLFDVQSLSYDEARNEGFHEVQVDVELLEKTSETVTRSLQFTNDRKQLLTKSWRFEGKTTYPFIDSLLKRNNMNYIVEPCRVDSVRNDFCFIDQKNRIFVGHTFDQATDPFTEITYYVPKLN